MRGVDPGKVGTWPTLQWGEHTVQLLILVGVQVIMRMVPMLLVRYEGKLYASTIKAMQSACACTSDWYCNLKHQIPLLYSIGQSVVALR